MEFGALETSRSDYQYGFKTRAPNSIRLILQMRYEVCSVREYRYMLVQFWGACDHLNLEKPKMSTVIADRSNFLHDLDTNWLRGSLLAPITPGYSEVSKTS